jgi:dedicator of cytokinesis protein 3
MKMGSSMGLIPEGSRRSSEISTFREIGSSTLYDASEGSNRSDLPLQFRRPFGCALLELRQLMQMATEGFEISSTKEHMMPIYVPTNETTFAMLHQDILNNNTKEFEKSPRYVSPNNLQSFCVTFLQSRDACRVYQNLLR